MQTGQSEFVVAYDPTYGLLPDLIEVGYNKLLGNRLPTTNVNQDNEFISMFNQQNPGAIEAGHSAGGTRLYLTAQNDVNSFENSRLQWFGAPVNQRDIGKLTNGNITNIPIIRNNPGDFVGFILGGNARTIGQATQSIIQAPLLITPWSPHSNYTCIVCKTDNDK